ncbi:MAG: hypothetical protein RLZZ505_397 [Verrucomicrobiota bacterium]|jgi:predicted Rossmann-fold nucleotide-binding protein
MEIMIERSDAFVIVPGGVGTVQEMPALMIFNRKDVSGIRFWAPLI